MPVVAAGAVVGLLYRVVTELVDGAAGLLVALLMVSLSWYRMLSVLVFAQVPLLLMGLLLVWAWLRWRRRPDGAAGVTARPTPGQSTRGDERAPPRISSSVGKPIRGAAGSQSSPALPRREGWRNPFGAGWALAIGAFAGWAAIVRPLDALCYAIPVGVGLLCDLCGRCSAPEGRQTLAHGASRGTTDAASTLPSSPAPEGRKNRGTGGASGRGGTPGDSYAPAGAGEEGREKREGSGLASPPVAPWAKVLRPSGAGVQGDAVGRGVSGGRSATRFRLLAPLLVLVAALPFLSLQLYFNHAVTGRWTQTPYTFYLERDQPHTSLGFHAYDPSLEPQTTLQQKRDYYRTFMLPYIREHQPATFLQSWATKYLPMIVDTTLPARLLIVLVPVGVLGLTDVRRRVLWATLPLFVAGYMLNTFFLEHYAAAVIPAVLLSVVLGVYVLADAFPRFRDHVLTAGVLVIVTVSLTSLYEFNPVATALDSPDRKHLHAIDDETFHSALLRFAHDLDALVEKPAVVLFKYSPGQNVIEEPVYNTGVAWPDDSAVIRAHDLGERNGEIFWYYAAKQPDRMFYRFDRATGQLTPLGRARDLAAAPQ
jgi:hypothetical protein